MSLAGYLFGNVDEQGRLDNDLDEDLKQTLQHVDADVFSRIFNPDTFGIHTSNNTNPDEEEDEEDDNDEQEDSDHRTSVYQQRRTQQEPTIQHAAGAIDYSDFDETVPDETATRGPTHLNYHHRLFGSASKPPLRTGSIPEIPKMPVKRMQPSTIPTRSLLSKRYHLEEDDDYDTPNDIGLINSRNSNSSSSNDSGSRPHDHSAASVNWHHHQISTPTPMSSSEAVSSFSASPSPYAMVDITQLFPAFKHGKMLNFSDLFMTRIKRRIKFQTPPHHQVFLNDGFQYETALDQRYMFHHQPLKRRKLLTTTNETDHQYEDNTMQQQPSMEYSSTAHGSPYQDYHSDDKDYLYHSVMLEPWENHILWDELNPEEGPGHYGYAAPAHAPSISNTNNPIKETILNGDLDSGDWLDMVIWDDDTSRKQSGCARIPLDPDSIKVILDLNDPHMLFDAESMRESQQQLSPIKHAVKKGRKPNPRPLPKMPLLYTSDPDSRSKLPQSRFNISNDRHYDMNFAVVRVRQTHGQLVVQHSVPALQLHRSLYKTKLSKAELRSFHRQLFQWPHNTDINFSRVRLNKKKPNKAKKLQQQLTSGNASSLNGTGDNDGILRTTKDLSLKDTCSFVLMEYSEEHPPIISNIGMGTLIVNYYRKTDPKDDYVPNMELGEPFVLEVEDTSPFMTFGNVEPGQTISVMYNNMVRAPLFRHQVKSTDFLLVRSTHHGQSRYYLREIPAIFVIGQTYPVQEVPGPQSRRVTTTVKNRLQIVAYRLIAKHPQQRLKMSKLASRFPEYQDIQVRQRLKEFLEFNRHSKDKGGGYWKVRAPKGATERRLPGEDQLRQMCTPEMVCLYESMLVGERHLLDLGYSNVNDDTADQDESNTSQLETEQQLAPWFATRNFINACQGKAMLKLSGEGDPTGCGEGFSFIRVSMKDIFLRAGESAEKKLAQIKSRPKSAHRYNVAEQQQVYREEIERIWSTQWNSLSQTEEPDYSPQEVLDEFSADEREMDQMNSPMTPENTEWRHQRQYDRATSEGLYDDMTDDNLSVAESYNSQAQHRNRELRISRHMRDDTGEIRIVIEVVKDPAVIKAYLAQRQLIMENAANLEAIDPTCSREKNARMKKQTQHQLEKLKKMTERRRQRQLSKTAALAENPVLGLMRGKREGAMRRCGNCGQLGHMKTNKSCPNFPGDKEKNSSKPVGNESALLDDLDDGTPTPFSSFTPPPTSSYTFPSL